MVGGGQGFWGDSPDAAIDMVRNGHINYMACDYLAELTLSIMARQMLKNANAGYARDFLQLLDEVAVPAREKGICILTNGGGMNTAGCVAGAKSMAEEKGLRGYRIAYVTGDDLTGKIDSLLRAGLPFENVDGEVEGIDSFLEIKSKIVNANVYFGHEPILACLQQTADVVITGRATDSALFLAPIMHELGWRAQDWDRLAKGIMAGHLLECGGQGAGGNFDYGWRDVPRMDELGFPIAEVSDEDFIITKTASSGGLISEQTCKEQFLYEVHDPANYITPDVVVDLSRATLAQVGPNRVRVAGIRGKPRPDMLKLSVGYHAGYKVEALLSFAWPDAYEKAQAAAEIVMKKMRRKGLEALDTRIDYIGLNALHLALANMAPAHIKDLNEVVLRIAIHTRTKEEAMKLVPEISPLQLNGPPGASFFGGRAHVQDVIALWPTLIPRELVDLKAHVITVE